MISCDCHNTESCWVKVKGCGVQIEILCAKSGFYLAIKLLLFFQAQILKKSCLIAFFDSLRQNLPMFFSLVFLSRPSNYFYIQDNNQVLYLQPKISKLKQEYLVSRKSKQEFYVSNKLKQAKQESSESSIDQEVNIYKGRKAL